MSAIENDGAGMVYLGGSFSTVGTCMGGGALYSTASTGGFKVPYTSQAEVVGTVYSTVSDGSGGYFVGGDFSRIGGQSISNLAHVSSDGSLDVNWNPVVNSSVYALTLSGTTLYAGGEFTQIGRRLTTYGSFVDTDSGQITSSIQSTLATVTGGVIITVIPDEAGGYFVGGNFTTVGGVGRAKIARINADGSLHAWNPGANSSVYSLALDGTDIYAGGLFTNIGGQNLNRVAKLNTGNNNADVVWNPNPTGGVPGVYSLLVTADSTYVGGSQFTNIGGQAISYLAKLNKTNGNADAGFNPSLTAGSTIRKLTYDGTYIYTGGSIFTNIGGQAINRLARINPANAAADATWNPNIAGGDVYSFSFAGSYVYLGGTFTTVGGEATPRLARILASDAAVDPTFAPSPGNNIVFSVYAEGSWVYAGGSFTSISGNSYLPYLARVSTADGSLDTDWFPNPNNAVNYLTRASGGNLYIGGQFTLIGGAVRSKTTSLDANTGFAVPGWSTGTTNNTVRALIIYNGNLYAGGDFTTISGTAGRNRLAQLNLTTGAASGWIPNVTGGGVYSLAASGGIIYLGGAFTSINGNPRNRIGAYTEAGAIDGFNPNSNSDVRSLILDGTTLYTGGAFTNIGGQARNRLAAVSTADGTASNWNPNIGGTVYAINRQGNEIYAGGVFSSAGAATHYSLVEVDVNTGAVSADWDSAIGGTVYALASDGTSLYAGGSLSNYNPVARAGLAKIDMNTGLVQGFAPNPDSPPTAIALSGSILYVGGNFHNISGFPGDYLVGVDTVSGTVVQDLSVPGPGAPNTLLVHGSKLFSGCAGEVSVFDLTNLSFVSITTDGPVYTFLDDTSVIYAGGAFTNFDGAFSPKIAYFDPDTLAVTAYEDFSSTLPVLALAHSGSFYIGGSFTDYPWWAGGSCTYMGSATATGLSDPSFNCITAAVNGTVRVIKTGGGGMFVGGDFTQIASSTNYSYLAYYTGATPYSTPSSAWRPSANGPVTALSFDTANNIIYVGGSFTGIAGHARSGFASLSLTDASLVEP